LVAATGDLYQLLEVELALRLHLLFHDFHVLALLF